MANYKRKKPRTQIRCHMCTDARQGNNTTSESGEDKKLKIRKDITKEQLKDIKDC